MLPFQLHPLFSADSTKVAAFHHAVWKEAYADFFPSEKLKKLPLESFVMRWQAGLQSTERICKGVFVADLLVGFMVYSRTPNALGEGELFSFYLDRTIRGKGYAPQLLQHVEEQLRMAGCRSCRLWTLHNNQRAIRFYQGAGYRPDGRRQERSVHGINLIEVGFRKALD